MKFERKLKKAGNSIALTIPKDVVNYLELQFEDEITLEVKEGKHGKFIAFWKKEVDTNADSITTQK